MPAIEANFDGLVGPTHNFGGLSDGNVASLANRDAVSRPRDAALYGLAKMKALADLGYAQGVLPPHERPFLALLRAAGFSGTDRAVWERAWREEPQLARNASAAAAMWTANAATVSPGADTADGKVHFTPANLSTMLHRSIEPWTTQRALKAVFADQSAFVVHPPLPSHALFSDEGAANHMRLSATDAAPGVEVFVWGREGMAPAIGKYPVRQTREAGAAIARRHGLDPARTLFIKQHPAAIEAGAFHNDVVAVANGPVLFCHERAFDDLDGAMAAIAAAAQGRFEPIFVIARQSQISLADAVASYLFNSQLLPRRDGAGWMLVAPNEVRDHPRALAYVDELLAQAGPIREVRTFDLRQSMRNGGGPACLRLRVELTADQQAKLTPGFWLTPDLYAALGDWVRTHYREELAPDDLRDPDILGETRRALDALTQILPLGPRFYDFQR